MNFDTNVIQSAVNSGNNSARNTASVRMETSRTLRLKEETGRMSSFINLMIQDTSRELY